jgi:hypothetical protein
MATKDDWYNLFAKMEAAFGQQPTPRHKMYIERLNDQVFESVCASVSRCIDECHFYPTIADILERMPNRVDPKAAALEQWQRVIRAAISDTNIDYNPHRGSTPNGRGLDPAILDAAGGPGNLCRIRDAYYAEGNDAQLGYLKLEFIARYDAMNQPQARPLLAYRGNEPRRIAPQSMSQVLGRLMPPDTED